MTTSLRCKLRATGALAIVSLFSALSHAQGPITLSPSVPSPAPLGTLVTWTAQAPGPAVFRFRVHEIGKDPRMAVDFGRENTFEWAPYEHEGQYLIEASARNEITGAISTIEVPFEVLSNASAGVPSIKETSHPLVFLYSAPPCSAGAMTFVTFTDPEGHAQKTPEKRCDELHSVNFLLAGLRPETMYVARHTLTDGDRSLSGPGIPFTSGGLPESISKHTAAGTTGSPSQGVLLAGSLNTNFVATDMSGTPIWYYPKTMQFLTHPETGGVFFGINQDRTGGEIRQIVRLFDLTGVTIIETNAARINEQLEEMGHSRIGSFHHEARFLSNGNILVLASVERILEDVQGDGRVNVLGDALVVLDRDLKVTWYWDAFDHLDPKREAVLGSPCNAAACPPLYLAPEANDWTHANSVAETPDGNLLISVRHQDWVVKVDYAKGLGSGAVLWRLGRGGDFQIEDGADDDWFSHQHDAEFESDGTLTLFDNGNTRRASDDTVQSRGQAMILDETRHTVKWLLNANLGVYSVAVGSAQLLDNGNYFFDCGFLADATAISIEVNPLGVPVHSLRSSAPEYRTFRMKNMYTP
ncbi:MAG: aryl-sulfate sulfotransferase [Bryobacteraceae bacterium]